MSVFEISEKEKEEIRKQHEEATKKFYQKRADDKAGLKAKEKPQEKPQEKTNTEEKK